MKFSLTIFRKRAPRRVERITALSEVLAMLNKQNEASALLRAEMRARFPGSL